MSHRTMLAATCAILVLVASQTAANQIWPADPHFFCDIRFTPYQWHENVMVCGDWDEYNFPCPKGDIYLTLNDGHAYMVGESLHDDHWDGKTTVIGCGVGGAFYEAVVAQSPLAPGRYDIVMDENQDGVLSGGQYPDYVLGNGSSWAFEVSPTECVPPPPGCEKPRAYVVEAYGGGLFDWWLVLMAKDHLEDQGWDAEILLYPEFTSMCETLRSDPCARGLYIVTHGTPNEWVVFYESGQRWGYTPMQVAQGLTGVELSVLTVSACYARPGAWKCAFPDVPAVRTPRRLLHDGSIYATWEWGAQRFHRHGTPIYACTPPGGAVTAPTAASSPCPGFASRDSLECTSFGVCDTTGCGQELYPTMSCRDSLGIPQSGVLALGEEQVQFLVSFHFPPEYADSVAASATLFSLVPPGLMSDELVPLGRHLLFGETARDSLVSADSIQVTMWYEDHELEPAGIDDETSLTAYWVSEAPDSGQFVPTAVDTLLNRIRFTCPKWGIAGIYGTPEQTGVAPPDDVDAAPAAGVTLRAGIPNPFNPITEFAYTLPAETAVSLTVFDAAGRSVAHLVSGRQEAGAHVVTWDARSQASGTYFVRLEAGGEVRVERVTLVK